MSDIVVNNESKLWDMNISLEELFKANPECKVDRSYRAHKYDSCYHGYCMYVKHPESDNYRTMLGIYEDGFTYLGDGESDTNFPMENTLEVAKEMLLYRDWLLKKEENKGKLLSKEIDYDCLD